MSTTGYQDSVDRFRAGSYGLDTTKTNLSLVVDGSPCNTNEDCHNKLNAALGKSITLAASYPCDLNVLGYDVVPECRLSSQNSERVE